MFYINDIVKVTKEAKEDTYENAWWTNINLKIDHIDKSMGEGEENTLYSFEDVEGKEVPNSLYAYELELVESSIEEAIKERLSYRYELLDYKSNGNIDESDEINYLEKVVERFSLDGVLDDILIDEMISFFEYPFEDKLYNAQYIEDYVDEFIRSCGVSNLRQAINGGIREYLYCHFFSNSETIYKNLIYIKLNEIVKEINTNGEIKLNEQGNLFLQVTPETVENIIDNFISEELDINYIYDKNCDTLYREFCEFLSDRIED